MDKNNEFLEKLSSLRRQASYTFKQPDFENMFDGVVDKYNDPAHFIFELLQNADDAKATEVEMILEKDRFIFIHNGSEKFTVSNPETSAKDRENNKLGHINAITAIGFSSKKNAIDTEVKIGKFGVGFKAIFQYTNTPHIYDDNFCFKIEDYIVPVLLEDTSYRQKGKTVFVVPFDLPKQSKEQSYKEIEDKLESLENPQLFLFNVKNICWRSLDKSVSIKKKIVKEYETNSDTRSVLYEFDDKKILIFSKEILLSINNSRHTIAIGYFLNNRMQIDTTARPKINCFFPTQECIDTCYIIHAPFALVDNRQQIKRKNPVNNELLKHIVDLSGESIVILRDISEEEGKSYLNDNIFDLISYDMSSINDSSSYMSDYLVVNSETVFLKEEYKKILNSERVFLSKNKGYILKDQILWATPELQRLVTSDQLSQLYYDDKIDYFCGSGTITKDVYYAYSIKEFSDFEFSQKITSEFMSHQPESWLSVFYEYILSKELLYVSLSKPNSSTSKGCMRFSKIIKMENGTFIEPCKQDNSLQVFFKGENQVSSLNTINSDLYSRCAPFRDVISRLGVKMPTEIDFILGLINDHTSKSKEENNELLLRIIRFYEKCFYDDRKSFISLLLDKISFSCYKNSSEGNIVDWRLSKRIYKKDTRLEAYFCLAPKCETFYLDEKYYEPTIKIIGEDSFWQFMNHFEFNNFPMITTKMISLAPTEKMKPGMSGRFKECRMIEGLSEVLSEINDNDNKKLISHFIWDSISFYLSKGIDLSLCDYSVYTYRFKDNKQIWTTCELLNLLSNSSWLYIDGMLKSPRDIYQNDVIEEAYQNDNNVFSYLNIRKKTSEEERDKINQMSETTKMSFEMGSLVIDNGVTSLEELQELINIGKASKRQESERIERENKRRISEGISPLPTIKKEAKILTEKDFSSSTQPKAPTSRSATKKKQSLEEVLSGFEEKFSMQKEELESVASLREIIEQSEAYSYIWLKSLMELEAKSNVSVSTTKSIKISFSNISYSSKTPNIISLSNASRFIPSVIESVESLPVTFNLRNEKHYIDFTNASVKENTLILRCDSIVEPSLMDLMEKKSQIINASIEIKEPIELTRHWKTLIDNLPFNDSDSVKDALRSDLKFIFGPPGTGKTTTLANRIVDLMSDSDNCKILVLSPTNKACDVITEKILDIYGGECSWLKRFVTTMSSRLEDENVVCMRNEDIPNKDQVCVVSTIARYAFDGFSEGSLNEIEWDFVIIDEASMIPLYQIIPPVLSPNSKNVWIAGDPFQIEPIVNIDLWKDENIYTMVDLKSFSNPRTTPTQFDIELLMTQYRSIPLIGDLYSKYQYDGKLVHARAGSDHRILNIGLKENPLNIISFPVGDDSICSPKRLMNSNIHIYSVIFAVEFLKFITHNLEKNNSGEGIKIGVLSPYGVEIQSIQKLYNQMCIASENITIDFGTSHGFQGDQCDIVVVVMNPPATGMKICPDMTFINKTNILNVAISRAKDYLYVLMPDSNYAYFDNMFELKKIGHYMTESNICNVYTSYDIEEAMLGEKNFIENNVFVTSHQSTNVYSDPFTKYEVRIDDNALDIQINSRLESL